MAGIARAWRVCPACASVLEYLRVPYSDVRDAKRVVEVQQTGEVYAPPFLLANGRVYSQTASIAAHLAATQNWPASTADAHQQLQCALFIMDVVKEVRRTEHRRKEVACLFF